MILHTPRKRPEPWQTQRSGLRYSWLVPLLAIEWVFDWTAFVLSRWSFLEVLEYLGSFSILVAVIVYFSESGDRLKQKHYQAWQVINTAQGKGGSGGRIEALQELNADKVPLVGVNASSAFLQGIRLDHANLLRADLSAADLRTCSFRFADLTYADLHSANFRGCNMENAVLTSANMSDADLVGSDLSYAKLDSIDLSSADLRAANLQAIDWKNIAGIRSANIAGVKNPPEGFREWALKNGAIENANAAN